MYRKGKVRCQPDLKFEIGDEFESIVIARFRFKTGILKTCRGRNLLKV
ncbi:hypothetical protein SAMN05216404_104141 [Nitrosospira multiformis]|uniref:Uncharacterized protein n=1 Tax=Nitrosospira multiformis TaxID=1231 RepID=A0A1H8GB24_9PROT|nr:hypothetical protein SAMN05216404_104141 [Nitrosospira multiformis]